MKLESILVFLFLDKASCWFIQNQTFLFGEAIQDRQLPIQNTAFLLVCDNISRNVLQSIAFEDLILPIEEINMLLPSSGKITFTRESPGHSMVINSKICLQLTSCTRTIILSIFLQQSVPANSSLTKSDTGRLSVQQQKMRIDEMIVFVLPTRITTPSQNEKRNEFNITILLTPCRRPSTESLLNKQKAVRESNFETSLPIDSSKDFPLMVEVLFEEIKMKTMNNENNECHETLCYRLDDFVNRFKGLKFKTLYFDYNESNTSERPVAEHYDLVIRWNTVSHLLIKSSEYKRVCLTDFRITNATKAFCIATEKILKRRELSQVRIEGVAASNATFLPNAVANSAEVRDCVKLTWHNVLHHSIFGRPTNFCQT
ncbi:BA75_02384T0 [Komagataella pastoris]|uniref:BA75_02384T0 n=1 Tax=Komagataella pastoris TaxID=4922 RepID=A0A1B2JAZ5_PICPA|nr:BA75_02384T0 [Komagataella pastoris]